MNDEHHPLNFDPNTEGIPDHSLIGEHLNAAGIPHDFHSGEHAGLALHELQLHGDTIPDWTRPEVAARELWKEIGPSAHEFPTPEVHLFDEALNWQHLQFTDFSLPPLLHHAEIHGTPDADIKLWEEQESPMSCAVATSNMLFRSIGLDPGEPLLAKIFQDAGIYDPIQGTDVSHLEDVLNRIAEAMGTNHHAEQIHGFTLEDLEKLLDQGVRPLIALNAEQIQDANTATLNDLGIIPDAGHAVQLTGIVEEDGHLVAILNDPGTPNGMGEKVPWEQFMKASSKSGYEAVALI